MLSWWRCQHMFVFLLLQLSMMGKTLPVTTNCTNGKKEKKKQQKKNNPRSRWHYLFSPVIPTECGTGSANSPACYPIVPLPGMAGGALFAKVDLKSRKASRSLSLSPWQAVNHLRWRAAWRRSASVDCSNCCATSLSAVLLTTCSCRTFVFFPPYFQLLFISPRRADKISPSFPTLSTNSLKKKKKTAPLLSITINPSRANYDPMTPLSHQKKPKKTDKKRMGEEGMEGGGGERSSL